MRFLAAPAWFLSSVPSGFAPDFVSFLINLSGNGTILILCLVPELLDPKVFFSYYNFFSFSNRVSYALGWPQTIEFRIPQAGLQLTT